MAFARLALRNLQQRALVSSAADGLLQRQRWGTEAVRRFAAIRADEVSDQISEGKGKEVAVKEGNKSKLFPKRQRKKWLWRNNGQIMPPGLGNALMQATENINRLLKSLNLSPWWLSGSVKEQDEWYKLRLEMPGIAKEDVKVTVEDRILSIKGEHKEEEGGGGEYWAAASYDYYDTSLMLPEDAEADEIKAELKDGVLTITIPRTEKPPHKDVKEVTVL